MSTYLKCAKDYYAVLGVYPNASPQQIKSTYRAKAKYWHPDTNPDPRAVEVIKEVNEAYEVLGNAQKRFQYDDCLQRLRAVSVGIEVDDDVFPLRKQPAEVHIPAITLRTFQHLFATLLGFGLVGIISIAYPLSNWIRTSYDSAVQSLTVQLIVQSDDGQNTLPNPPVTIEAQVTYQSVQPLVLTPVQLVPTSSIPTRTPRPVPTVVRLSCANSLPTRFEVGQHGYTERQVNLRATPGNHRGETLDPFSFVIIDGPECAYLGESTNHLLWWYIRVESGPAFTRTGWVAESFIEPDGRAIYLIFPR